MHTIEAGNIGISIDDSTGGASGLSVMAGKHTWTRHPGEVVVRDDLLRRSFGAADLANVKMSAAPGRLSIRKTFRGAPWTLEEVYTEEPDCVRWDAKLTLPEGEFRSAAISWEIPMAAAPYSWWAWTARHDMPKELYKTASEEIEYAEATAGTLIPAFAFYLPKEKWGFAVCKPFGLRASCLRFGYGLREPRFRVRFDHQALSPEHTATASLLFRGIPGCWRPALGWIYERHREYFESASALLPTLWGGHDCSGYDQSEADIAAGAAAGERWCEIHAHFPHYGQYDAQKEEWVSITHAWHTPPPGETVHIARHREPKTEAECTLSAATVRRTIERLNKHGIAAMPYIQVSGDANPPVAERFTSDEIRDINGDRVFWRECGSSVLVQMNADDALPFGKHLDEMIAGMLDKYTGARGVFVDQACYNFVDTAHFDGITAIDNRPCYMTGFNYWNRLARVAARVHPDGAIMANGPFAIEMMRHIDGVMAEGLSWLCDHQKYGALAKPVYFLMYEHGRVNVELMLQNALVYAAGYTAAAWSKDYRDIYDAYTPLLKMLDNRRWVFDPDPLALPAGLRGDIYRAADRTLLVSVVREHALKLAEGGEGEITIRTVDASHATGVELYQAGACQAESIDWELRDGAVVVKALPKGFVAGLLRVSGR